jgi:CHAT domain-containing protein
MVRHSQTFDAFVRGLRRSAEPLRVLLIASDTGGLRVDEEVAQLEKILKVSAKSAGLTVATERMLTDTASLGELERRLQSNPYHVIHYAGHAEVDEQSPENSGLIVFKDKRRSGGRTILTSRQLAQLLAGSQTRLVFLNACVGAWVGAERTLRDNDYLGLMDAVVTAGVPYALGYRWSVTDSGGRLFATSFYERLLGAPAAPELAVLQARSRVYGRNGEDETWTSPILVAQNVHH